jgi:hypothetical protein
VARDSTGGGALQAIRYREFEEYLVAITGDQACAGHSGEGDNAAAPLIHPGGGHGLPGGGPTDLLQHAVDTLRLRTRQYAMKQLSWIRNRFVGRGLTVHQLDSGQPGRWGEAVWRPAEAQVAALLAGQGNTQQHVPSAADAARQEDWVRYSCAVCGIECVGPTERQQHLSSGKHRRAVAAAAALPRQWLAMYHTLRQRGDSHSAAESAVRAVPRFAPLDHGLAAQGAAAGAVKHSTSSGATGITSLPKRPRLGSG